MKSQITENKVILSVLHLLLDVILLHQEKETSYIGIPKKSI